MFNIKYIIDQAAVAKTKAALTLLQMGGLPNLQKAIGQAAQYARNEWIKTAMQSFKHSTGGYIGGIVTEYPVDADPLQSMVTNRIPYASALEDGVKSYDMKKMLQTSHQVRISKKGKRYLIIPFRHLMPGDHEKGGMSEQRATGQSMPSSVYQMAVNLSKSQIKGTRFTPSLNPESKSKAKGYSSSGKPLAQRWDYAWGGKLKGVGGIYEGMRRFKTTGGGSQYITFRVMSENSAGWIHPGIAPLNICKRTATRIEPVIQKKFQEAFEKDVREAMSA